MDLFDYGLEQELLTGAPLAERMRPKNLEEILGQEEIIGPGSLLRKAIEADNLSSLVLHGPPGSGKTTFARVVSLYTKSVFVQVNAVTSGVQELRKLIEEAKKTLGLSGRRTILFIDEIHRYSKSQQDALLPAVEKGIIILIGATTENPYFYLVDPLISRSLVYKFNSLRKEDLVKIMKKALEDETRGLKSLNPRVREDALDFLAAYSDGDARRALNALEFAVKTAVPTKEGERIVDPEAVKASLQKNHLRYDKAGDQHYDIISAFIKSIRGSDPDAAVYWLARMLASGEDPLFICRRL
ncbi:MAG TPA: replication-associated recombination protein A, partial [Firmicutes bacterium]|nr:replication-associated recombination protein A [Bacillota bacterium]